MYIARFCDFFWKRIAAAVLHFYVFFRIFVSLMEVLLISGPTKNGRHNGDH